MLADQLLVARNLAPSRTAAQRVIAAGRVRTDLGRGWETVAKSRLDLPTDTPIEIVPDGADRFVSRGGLKLAGALARAGLDVSAYFRLDIGQSTGGFSDCLLQAGAARVVEVEVGHGQLHPRLRADPRLACREGVNARDLRPDVLAEHFPHGGFDPVVTDASFISLTLLLPGCPVLLRPGGTLLALVKPQFEVGPSGLGKGGIVRDPSLYAGVEATIRAACARAGLAVRNYFESSITGGDGNREFFVHAQRPNINSC